MSRRWPEPGHASPADLAACRALLREGSRTFSLASLLLPDRIRMPVTALYAFCRHADDAVDLDPSAHSAPARLQARLDRVYAGRPLPFPVDRAFADVVREFALPRLLPEALIEGFAWDVEGRRYEDLADLFDYAARVAGTVGAMMAMLMGVRDAEAAARACALGMAMQLTNIARDVGEDAANGRLYLPLRWLREAGIDPDAWLRDPHFDTALATVIQRLLAAADELYARADPGIAHLPASCRPAIRAARLIYAEIGRELERRGCDPLAARAVVPLSRKARLLGRALVGTGAGEPMTALPAARFLVEAVAAAPPPPPALIDHDVPWWDLGYRARWVIDLFLRLERRDRLERSESIS